MIGRMTKRVIKLYENISIKYKLLLVFYIQISISLIFFGYLSYQKSASTLRTKSIMYSQDILKMIELRLKDFAADLYVVSSDPLYDQSIYNIINDGDQSEDPLTYYKNMGEVTNVLRKVAKPREEIQAIYLISQQKKVYAFDSQTGRTSSENLIPYDEILKKAREGKGKPIWYLEIKNNHVETVYLTRTINSLENYEEIGLMAIQIKKEFLESILQDLSIDVMQNITILSQNYFNIVSRQTSMLNTSLKFDSTQIVKDRGYYIDSNSKALVSYIILDDPNWKIITHISLNELYREINEFRNWSILLLIGTLLILSIFSILTAVDIVDPIHKLVEAMKKVEKGKEHGEISIDRNDELGYLSKTFSKMASEINYLMKWIYREQITRKEAEIKALQAQINPHFLFNTLESINWMAQLNGVPEISKMVGAVSSLMEANMGRDSKLITLQEEVNYIDNYILILKNRYGDRLEVFKEIDESVLNIKIPRLLLQPIMENAIYHGIEKIRKKGKIIFKAYQSQNDVIIEVIDNGIGMREEEVDMLNQRFESSSDQYFKEMNENNRKSIGLENVNRRIKLFYGEEYGLTIESIYHEFAKVILRIPAQGKKEGDGLHVQGINC